MEQSLVILAQTVGPKNHAREEYQTWQEQGNCLGVDTNLFFPERGASIREAKGVCRSCVVQPDCLEYALNNGIKFGIWGGLSELERGRIRRQRARAARPIGGAAANTTIEHAEIATY